MPSSPLTDETQSEDASPVEPSDASELSVSDLTGLLQQFLEGLRDLKRVGLPSAELDSLQEKHPDAYDLYIDEQRIQPTHDRNVELQQLGLATRQIQLANDAQNAQRDVAMRTLDIQEEWLSIAQSNARTGRALSRIFAITVALLTCSALAINSVFVWYGKLDSFTLATSVIISLVGAGGFVALVRALIGRRRDGRSPTDSPPHEETHEGH